MDRSAGSGARSGVSARARVDVHRVPRAHRGQGRPRGPAHSLRGPSRTRHERPPPGLRLHVEEHADAVAAALDAAGATGAELIGHSMGGAVAVVLAHRRPGLVSRLVLTEANLDAFPPVTAASSEIASYEEDEFVERGYARVLDAVGPLWAATMRLADPRALHRSAVGLRRGSDPVMRTLLEESPVDRVFLQGAHSGELPGREALESAGVRVVTVPAAGHNIMFDNPDAFAAVVVGIC
ncbi:alpha/beta hydrolase [Streptomyces sp. NPDC029006]|uniref:alpha/beta fold hydrolase n=1 Tax=Streptomyces sp. NPDC029006 TaxID=3155467 RepID=UPI0033D3A395